jgi:stalled ribosome alternative rescue factor ArfA
MIKSMNPIARAMLKDRKPKQVVKPKKGKGSYDRKKSKSKLSTDIKTSHQ